jgi:nitric oxide dioxygenase
MLSAFSRRPVTSPPLTSLLATARAFHASHNRLAAQLSPKTIEIIKATAPVVADFGYKITTTMYKRMFTKYPEVKAMFNQGHQVEKGGERAHQPSTLAASVYAYAANIDNLGVLGEAVERIAQKHVSLNVLPHQYGIVGENLLWALQEVLGDKAAPDIVNAWGEAYQFLADIFIKRETEIRESMRDCPGGWEGWRDFVVSKRVRESSLITSLYLHPKDGGKLPVRTLCSALDLHDTLK